MRQILLLALYFALVLAAYAQPNPDADTENCHANSTDCDSTVQVLQNVKIDDITTLTTGDMSNSHAVTADGHLMVTTGVIFKRMYLWHLDESNKWIVYESPYQYLEQFLESIPDLDSVTALNSQVRLEIIRKSESEAIISFSHPELNLAFLVHASVDGDVVTWSNLLGESSHLYTYLLSNPAFAGSFIGHSTSLLYANDILYWAVSAPKASMVTRHEGVIWVVQVDSDGIASMAGNPLQSNVKRDKYGSSVKLSMKDGEIWLYTLGLMDSNIHGFLYNAEANAWNRKKKFMVNEDKNQYFTGRADKYATSIQVSDDGHVLMFMSPTQIRGWKYDEVLLKWKRIKTKASVTGDGLYNAYPMAEEVKSGQRYYMFNGFSLAPDGNTFALSIVRADTKLESFQHQGYIYGIKDTETIEVLGDSAASDWASRVSKVIGFIQPDAGWNGQHAAFFPLAMTWNNNSLIVSNIIFTEGFSGVSGAVQLDFKMNSEPW